MRPFISACLLSLATLSVSSACVHAQTPPVSHPNQPSESAKRLMQGPRYLGPKLTLNTEKGDYVFTVALAQTPYERQMGLMWITQLLPELGMFFVMNTQEIQTFWMKNTLIPLDIIFIDESFKVVGIVENAEPLTTTPRNVDKPSRYVLELRGGRSSEIGLKAGDSVFLEGFNQP